MGRNEWENGRIKLPTAEFARIRKTLEEATKAQQEKTFEASQVFWKGLTRKQQTDKAEYNAAVDKHTRASYDAIPDTRGWYNQNRENERADHKQAISDLENLLMKTTWGADKPRRVQKTDIDWATNRTTRFHTYDLEVSFDKETSTVHWDVQEGKNAATSARDSKLGRTLLGALKTVKWSRDTGGAVYGSDEYAVDGAHENGYAHSDSMVYGFGPIGAAENPFTTGNYLDSKGQTVNAMDVYKKAEKATLAAQRKRNRQPQGVPTGGQFASHYRGESNVGLGSRW